MKLLLSLARQEISGLAITILAGFAGGISTVWQAWLLSRIISRVFLENATLQDVAGFLRLLLLAAALQGILIWISEISARSVAISIKNELRQRLFRHILHLGPAFTRGERSGALTTAANEGIEALDAYFSQYLPQLVLAALVPLGILFFVFPIDLLSAIILAITAPLIPVFMILIGKAAQNLTNRQYETLSRLSAHFLDSLQGLKTLKLFGRSKVHGESIDQAAVEFRDRTLAVLRVTFLSALVLELVSTLSTAIIAVEIGLRLLYFRLIFEQALFILVIAPAFYLPLRLLGTRFHAGMAGSSAARAIFELLNTQPQNRGQASLPCPESLQANGQPLVALQNITYTYPGEAQPVLKNLSLELYPGEFVAVVGPSGAGKSTLAQLILGFLQPNEGLLLLNGRPFQAIDLKAWRESIAWVPQDPYLFHDTIAANLRLGAPGCSDQEMEAAARLASLDAFIAGLPEGYNTVIMESGGRLSSGEAQRLALGRAFLRQAPLILLDEPTSSVDPITESRLEAATRLLIRGSAHQAPGSKPVAAKGGSNSHLLQKRTALVIAHRLNTIRQADRILALADGRLYEIGSLNSLLQQGGLYAEMVTSHLATAVNRQQHPSVSKLLPAAVETPPPVEIQQETSPWIKKYPSSAENIQDAGLKSPQTFHRLFGFLKSAWDQVTLSVLLGAATNLSGIGLIGTSAWLISTAALHPSIAVLQVAVVGVRTFGLARGLFRYLERLTSHRVTFNLLARLRRGFYDALEPLAPARLMAFRSGDLLSRTVSDIETLENFYVRVVLPPLVALLVCGGTLFFIWQYSPALVGTLLLPLLALAILIPLWIFLLSRGIGTRLVQLQAALRRHILDGIQGLPDLLAFGREMDWSQEIAAQGKALGRVQMRFAAWRGFHSGMALFLSSLAAWLALVITIPLVTSGALEGVMLAVLVLVAQAVFEAVAPLPLAAEVLNGSLEAARRVFALVDAPAAVKDPATPLPPPRCESTLEVQELTFRYRPDLPPALQNLSLRLERNKKIALVGPSGAGKSTLVNLLLRFWEDEPGSIRLDGQELHRYSQEDVRRCFAVVPADPYFFNTTVRENLLLAWPGASTAEVETAARRAQIHDFILTLPQGYETIIGERGLRLSGGQRQRLSIARALLKDAPILVTDEPTADLDPISERSVLETLLNVAAGRALLHITHRLVFLEAFDEIIVLDCGQVIQRGRHHDLLNQGGLLYRQMWEIQGAR